jgi:hypothetical protein
MTFTLVAAFASLSCRAVFAQSTEQASDEPVGVRITPEIARAMAHAYIYDMVIPAWKLDREKAPELVEKLAGRLMAAAHEIDGPAQDLLELIVAEGLMTDQEPDWSSPELARQMAQRLKPVIPVGRKLLREMAAEVRPQLDPKQQLRYSAWTIASDVALQELEKNMQRRAEGQARQEEDPFAPDYSGMQRLNEKGESGFLSSARTFAESFLQDSLPWNEWEEYIRQAAEHYGFDAGQTAAAESLLREYLNRASIVANDAWRQKVVRNRIYDHMIGIFGSVEGMQGSAVLTRLLDAEHQRLMQPITDLDIEFKTESGPLRRTNPRRHRIDPARAFAGTLRSPGRGAAGQCGRGRTHAADALRHPDVTAHGPRFCQPVAPHAASRVRTHARGTQQADRRAQRRHPAART